jgi:hypothetical protein
MLLKKGVLGSGAFAVDDRQKTYAELKARGVQPPAQKDLEIILMEPKPGPMFSHPNPLSIVCSVRTSNPSVLT